MLQALKFPLFYPKIATKFKGLGSSCDVMLVAKVCLPSVTFSTWVLAAPKDKRCLVIRKASMNQKKVESEDAPIAKLLEMREKEPPYWILNWSCNQQYVTSHDILTFSPHDLKTFFSGQNSATLNACNQKRLKLWNRVFQKLNFYNYINRIFG